ncbi:hypothetical protein MPSEU_000570700 [Mayamaea pseudoterrestris]|nr:hypothetical protein MPSEU_000570700 [Mayamaea pseudoterrestris]
MSSARRNQRERDVAVSNKKKRRGQHSNSTEDDDEAKRTAAVITSDPALFHYLEQLRAASDLPTLYANLMLTKKAIREKQEEEEGLEVYHFLAPADIELVESAGTAVAFLMCQKAIEVCTLPKTLGGLAFAQAKADNIVRHLFETIGIAACFEDTTEQDLVKVCRGKDTIEAHDLRKVLPKLKSIGADARGGIDQINKEVHTPKEEDLIVVQAYAV